MLIDALGKAARKSPFLFDHLARLWKNGDITLIPRKIPRARRGKERFAAGMDNRRQEGNMVRWVRAGLLYPPLSKGLAELDLSLVGHQLESKAARVRAAKLLVDGLSDSVASRRQVCEHVAVFVGASFQAFSFLFGFV